MPDPVRSSPTPLALFTSHWYVLYITKLLRTIVLLIDCASENLFAYKKCAVIHVAVSIKVFCSVLSQATASDVAVSRVVCCQMF